MTGMKLIFVCTGNTCRSPMAEGLMKKLLKEAGIEDWEVSSRGTFAIKGVPAAEEAVQAMAEKGVDITGHRARPLSREDIKEADLILTMTKGHKFQIFSMFAEEVRHIHTLKEFSWGYAEKDIADPIGKPVEVYRTCAEEIEEALMEGFNRIVHYRKGE